MSKVISRLFWFCLTRLCDWLTKFAPLSQPMRSKSKTNLVRRSHVFSSAWRRLHAFASSSDWSIVLFTFLVIGRSNNFGLVLRHSDPVHTNAFSKVFVFGVIENASPNRSASTLLFLQRFQLSTLKRSKTLNDMLCHRLNNMCMLQRYCDIFGISRFWNNSLRNKIVPPCACSNRPNPKFSRPSIWCFCSSTMMGRSLKSQCPYNRCSSSMKNQEKVE